MIVDPAARFIDQQHEELVDFVFRMTADRGRAGVMAREVSQQIKDELDSSEDFQVSRMQLFQRAYQLNHDAMRALDRAFLEPYFRYQITSKETIPRLYRWELFLLELQARDALLLLLSYRHEFELDEIGTILDQQVEDLELRLEQLEVRVRARGKLQLTDLKALPKYGFLNQSEEPNSSLSDLMRGMRTRQIRPWPYQLRLLITVGFGLTLAALLWQQKPVRDLWHKVWHQVSKHLP